MIEKDFIYFKTKEGYNNKKSEVPNQSLVFIEDTKEFMTHGISYNDTSEVESKITALEEIVATLTAQIEELTRIVSPTENDNA